MHFRIASFRTTWARETLFLIFSATFGKQDENIMTYKTISQPLRQSQTVPLEFDAVFGPILATIFFWIIL